MQWQKRNKLAVNVFMSNIQEH